MYSLEKSVKNIYRSGLNIQWWKHEKTNDL